MATQSSSNKVTKKSAKVSKVSKAKEPEPVAEPPKPEPVPEPVAATVDETENEGDVEDQYAHVMATLRQCEATIKALVPVVKRLQKQHAKDVKAAEKSRKKRVRNPDAPPSGFARPGKVSNDLSKFLGLGDEELIARTQVAKRISAYIKDNDLKNPENKKEIILDDSLSKLFKVPFKTHIEFFKIQSYLSPHFIKE